MNEKSRTATTPHWLFTLTALLAMGSLYATGRSTVLFGVAVALVAVHLTDQRLENGTWPVWIIRFLAGALIFTSGNDPGFRGADTFLTGRSMDWFGQYCAVEMTLQCWIRRPQLPTGKLTGLCVMVFLAASNTVDTGYIRYLAPLYLLLLIRAMNAFAEQGGTRPERRFGPTLAVGVAATVLALGTGGAGFYGLWIWRGEITRWSNDLLFGNPSDETGLSTDPRLGATRDLRGPLHRVLRVDAQGGSDRQDISHLRGLTFYTYEEGRWGPQIEGRLFRSALPLATGGTDGGRLHITRLVSNSGFLFLPLGTRSVSVEKGTELLWDQDGGRTVRGGMTAPFEYEVTLGGTTAAPAPLAELATADERALALEVPGGIDPQVHALALRIAREAGLPIPSPSTGRSVPNGRGGEPVGLEGRNTRALVEAVETYLTRNHEYSLSTNPGVGDPVSNFLLERKAAHCEYFASSAVILLRCLGVPARYVSGYYLHERTGLGLLIARQRDAHAWAEALVPGEGGAGERWVTVEATPATGRPDATDGPIPAWTRLSEWMQDAIDVLRGSIVRSVGITGAVIIGVSVIAFLVWRDIRRQKRLAPEPVYRYSTPPDMEALARRFEMLLGRRGYDCPADRTWNEHLEKLARAPLHEGVLDAGDTPVSRPREEILKPLGAFVDRYNRARFGGAPTPETLAELDAQLRQLEASPSGDRAPAARN